MAGRKKSSRRKSLEHLIDLPLHDFRRQIKELTKRDLTRLLDKLDDRLARQQRYGVSRQVERFYERRIDAVLEELERRG